jgi:7,8-dihydropterin-6-yl-methyl-4-(beta-D-ribofuranosyl)aminobenzene 5'-phosphate synthase
MKLTVLTENMAGGPFLAEHGLSYFIEHDKRKILFDTGHSDVFLRNAERLDLDLQKDVETIVLSHGHWDHGNGLKYISNKTLITHPMAFIKRYRSNDDSDLGLSMNKQEAEQRFNLITSDTPYKISDTIIFLGEIPRLTDFESDPSYFIDEKGNPDHVPDDSALAIIHNNGLIVITGCSHSGICNIIEYARKVSHIDKVNAVIGGFHLKHTGRQTQTTIRYFLDHKIETIYPSHCTELPALAAFYHEFGAQQLKTGMVLDF